MKNKLTLLIIFIPFVGFSQTPEEYQRWKKHSSAVKITRDNFGIPHINGKTDADAVFGLMYAQCEDDFARVEQNYIEKLGRLSEVMGVSQVYNDLQTRLIIDSADAVTDYNNSEPWLKELLNAFADGVNFYIHNNPGKPRLLNRFEPWYPLLWTDGSIGATSTGGATIQQLKDFYEKRDTVALTALSFPEEKLSGSNGFAFSPAITSSGNSILYINPHVTFYFRPEVHMKSRKGLNAYGAVTWGQFFIYQGFNEHCGWMHTSSDVDVADLYAIDTIMTGDKIQYNFEGQKKNIHTRLVTIRYTEGGRLVSRTFTAYYTHHGPVIASSNGKWFCLKAKNRTMAGLVQSWQRTKAKSFSEYKKSMELYGNTSNNTVYADKEGNIAYWHGNFIPVRDSAYDWAKPVDGSTAQTAWKGFHTLPELIHVYNPPEGWLQNCNSTPFTVAGSNSPNRKDYPKYMSPEGDNFRGEHAVKILSGLKNVDIDKVIRTGYDSTIPIFHLLIPRLTRAFDNELKNYPDLAEPMNEIRKWDFRVSVSSVAQTLAVEWAYNLYPVIMKLNLPVKDSVYFYERAHIFTLNASDQELLDPLRKTIAMLEKRNGSWRIPWGEINRFQRISGSITEKFSDALPSLPVPYVSSTFGMLPSYSGTYHPGTNKRYGVHGNSFVCVVEFGRKIRAKSLLAGGQSGDPSSPHFFDQGEMYASGKFKEVLFYKKDIRKKAIRVYRPGN